jgi:rare lipoprotein A
MSVFRGPIHAGFALLALFVLGAAGCGHRSARVKLPAAPARIGTSETGVASWYGIPYNGRRAASGEIYDMEKLTAAHRKLPFETWVEVTNLSNGKRVDVRINDRGPFARRRIIDLSQAAARDIDMLGPGTARVRLKVIAPPREDKRGEDKPREEKPEAAVVAATLAKPEPANTLPAITQPEAITQPRAITQRPATTTMDGYVVQAGAFADRDRAESLRTTLEDLFAEARVMAGSRNLWRVIVGREMTLDQANELAVRVRKELGTALVVPEPGPNRPAEPSTPQ